MTAIRIRRATTADRDAVVEGRLAFLCEVRQLRRDELTDEFVGATRAFVERTDASSYHTWLAEDPDGRPVGLVSLITSDAPPRPEELRSVDGYIVNMHVVPDQRRLGIAQRLLDACLAAAPELGIRRIDLHATDDGRPLYARNGFTDATDWMQRRVER